MLHAIIVTEQNLYPPGSLCCLVCCPICNTHRADGDCLSTWLMGSARNFREFVNPEVLDKTPQALKYHFHSQTDYQKYWKGNNVSSQQLCKIIFHTSLACLVNQSLPLFFLWCKPCFHLMHLYQLELPQLLNSSWKAPSKTSIATMDLGCYVMTV